MKPIPHYRGKIYDEQCQNCIETIVAIRGKYWYIMTEHFRCIDDVRIFRMASRLKYLKIWKKLSRLVLNISKTVGNVCQCPRSFQNYQETPRLQKGVTMYIQDLSGRGHSEQNTGQCDWGLIAIHVTKTLVYL
jgi:hypothetical protein